MVGSRVTANSNFTDYLRIEPRTTGCKLDTLTRDYHPDCNLIVSSLPILCINIRNYFGNNCLFGKNVKQTFNDTGEFLSIGTIYTIQYSCCKRLIRLWKKIIQTMNLVRNEVGLYYFLHAALKWLSG